MRSQDPLLTGLRILGYLFVYYMQMTLTKATHMSGSNTNAGEHTSRIFGGYPAKQEDTMHQVSIRYVPWEKKAGFGKGHMAGGSLIRWNVVLSAAHCFWDKDVDMMVVVMGNLDRFTKTDTLSFGIERVAMYQDYDPVTIENDIALAFLRDSVPEDSPHICPIAISTKRFENYEECQMTGWGQTEHAHAVGELLVCDVSALTLTTCKETSHIPTSYLMTGMMCAGVERSGMGACFGDSGGPMVSHRQLIGIVSWLYGEKCAKVRRPTVLTEVYCYQDWITHEINNNWSEESRINAKLRLAQCSAAKRLRDSRLMAMMVFAKKIAFYLLALSFLLLMVQVPAIDGQDAAKTGTEERVADPRVEPEEEKDEKDTEFYEGTVAQAKDTMHQVSVRKKEIEASMGFGHGHFCGGSLISWNIVLSAGVCFHRKNISNIVIVMGNVNRFEKANSLSFDIANVTLHPDFKPETIENDIAMVVLKDHVSPTESSVHPIELDSNPVESGKMCELTGWGESNTVHISEELRTVSVKALDFKGCGKLHTVPENLLHKGHMCAKMPEGGKGSCTADSGGPMVCGGVLSGIVASGVGQRCTAPGLPAVVSEMNYYLKWIDEELKKICCSGEKVIKKKKGKSSNSGVVGLRNRNLPLTGCLVVFTLLVAALS